jgi:hypothetical protein
MSMVFDYPESYPFSNSTGSIGNMLGWIIRYITSRLFYKTKSHGGRSLAGILEVLPEGDEKKSTRSLLSSKESILSELAERAKGKAVQQELGL